LANLTGEGFEKLLQRLDANPSQAAEKYEEMRRRLVKFYVWRGCPHVNADELADETINRVAAKLAEGIEIESINAFSNEISRFIWLEFSRKRKEFTFGNKLPEQTVAPETVEESDERLACLKKCLAEIAVEGKDRELIIGYYDRDEGEKQKEARKSLAEKFGLKMNALKVKACRLRFKLEKCVSDCLAKT
jgi:DNA-directed RNA polymerase specialized sigma24 family protein